MSSRETDTGGSEGEGELRKAAMELYDFCELAVKTDDDMTIKELMHYRGWTRLRDALVPPNRQTDGER